MWRYYAWLALRSVRSNPLLSGLMVLAIGLGIGASMTTLTVLRLLSGDPLPQKSAVLYYPQVDPRDANARSGASQGKDPPNQMAYADAVNLWRAQRADRQAVMVAGRISVRPAQRLNAFYADGRQTTADFFAMFATPFQYGAPWTAADDDAHARVAVISQALNDKLFGGANSVGRSLRMADTDWRIVGVLKPWRPLPRFYDLSSNNNRYGHSEDVYVPFFTARELKIGLSASIQCWSSGADIDNLEAAPCSWLQFWVELDSAAKASAYREFLIHYSQEQKTLGRFQREPNVRLNSLLQWLDYRKVVPGDARLQTWLALGFLLVCLVNTVGLLLAKFLRRAPEIGVRRALGASRAAVFLQCLCEAGAIGLAGGGLGWLLSLAGLWAVRQQPAEYADLAHLDLTMFCATFVAAIVASVVAGLLPAWRACQIPPALQLKSN